MTDPVYQNVSGVVSVTCEVQEWEEMNANPAYQSVNRASGTFV